MIERGCLPTALIICPINAEARRVYDYLNWRDDVCLPAGVKETFFFNHYYRRGPA